MKREILKIARVMFILGLLLALVIPANAALAQDAATLSGTVRDQNGLAVADAEVEVANAATGQIVWSMLTDNDGYYILSVVPGTYDILVSPPPDSGLEPEMVYVQIITTDIILDFILVPPITSDSPSLPPLGEGGHNPVKVYGTVKDNQGNPFFEAEVQVINPANGQIVVSDLTDIDGYYEMMVDPAGTYDVKAVPPAGSGYGPTIVLGIDIITDMILNFILVPPGVESVTLSGKVLDPLGNGIPSQHIELAPAGTADWITSTTDASGSYFFNVAPGSYRLYISGHNTDTFIGAPRYYYMYSYSGAELNLTENTIMDIPLPVHRVSIHVEDPAGNPVTGVTINTNDVRNNNLTLGILPAYGWSYYSKYELPATTDASGDTTLWLFPTPPVGETYTLTATPPPESPFAVANLYGVSFTTDTSVTITLVESVTLSGRVLDPMGQGIPGQNVYISPAGASIWTRSFTDAEGNYFFKAAPGDYQIVVTHEDNQPSANAPPSYELRATSTLSLTESTIMDIPLPEHSVSVHVQDPAGNPVADVGITTNYVNNPNLTLGTLPASGSSSYPYSHAPAITNVSGDTTLWLFPTPPGSTYTLTANPPPGSGLAFTSLSGVSVIADISVTITLVEAVTLSGRVLDQLGNGIPGQGVYISPAGVSLWTTSITDAEGNYFLEVAPGDYQIRVAHSSSQPSANAPPSYQLRTISTLSLTENMVMDIPLPEYRVSVHVQDPAGNPVTGVTINTNWVNNYDLALGILPAYGYSRYDYGYPITDTNGDADLWLFPNGNRGTYIFTATPLPESPYATFHVHDVQVVSDMTIIIVLEFAHAPPVTTASVSPEPDEQGIYHDPVTVNLSATACEGYTVDATYYIINGGETQTYTGPFLIAEDGTHTIEYWSVDNVGVFEIPKTLTLEILLNQPPTADAGGPYLTGEGDIITLNGSGSTDPDDNIVLYEWDLDNDDEYDDATGITTELAFDDNGIYTIGLKVTDEYGESDTDTALVTVNNVTAIVDAGPDATIDEGDIFSQSGSFTDPGADSWTGTVDYGDDSGTQPLMLNPDKTFDLSYIYADNGSYNVTVNIDDGDGGIGTNTVTVTVNNVAPVANAGEDKAGDEPATFTFIGSYTDPGTSDTHTYEWDFDYDGVTFDVDASGTSVTNEWTDDFAGSVALRVTDDDGGWSIDTCSVTVSNVAPTITSLVLPRVPVDINEPVTLASTFSDPGYADTHDASIDWGDGIVEELLNVTSPVEQTHNYTSAGVYTVTLTITDDDGASDAVSSTYYIVIYDPDGSFVTGGGWITSPAGAYTADPSLTGKAIFGFVSKYKKGQSTPTGNTEFQFKVGDLNFHSDSYDWLVIAGNKAMYKGTGTINGEGNYGFFLSAIDAAMTPSTDVDLFRIKIWDKASGEVIYDNQMGASEDEEPTTQIGGGNIVIHKD